MHAAVVCCMDSAISTRCWYVYVLVLSFRFLGHENMAKWLISNFPVLYLMLKSSVQLSRTANLNQRLLATNWKFIFFLC